MMMEEMVMILMMVMMMKSTAVVQAAMQCIRWFLIQPRLGADRSSAISSGSSVLRSARNNDIRPVIHHEGEDSTNSTEGITAVMMRALWSSCFSGR